MYFQYNGQDVVSHAFYLRVITIYYFYVCYLRCSVTKKTLGDGMECGAGWKE